MVLSCCYEGKVFDFHYKQNKSQKFIYNFYIGDVFIGQLFKLGKHDWSAVPWHEKGRGKSEQGFGSRYQASNYLLKVTGFISKES